MRSKAALVLVLASISAIPAAAQLVTGLHVLPVAIHAPGVPPAFWATDVFVLNYNTHAMKVGFLFFPADEDNVMPLVVPSAQTRALESGETLLVEDVVKTVFGLESAKGVLWVVSDNLWFPENEPDAEKLIVTSRIFNSGSDARGTFGQTVTNILLYFNFDSVSSWITGARNDDSFRCNLGIGSWGPDPITVHYRVTSSDGTVVAAGAKQIPGWSLGQWSLASLGVAKTPGPLSIELWLDPGDLTPDLCTNPLAASGFFAYVSPVDGAGEGQGTGDGEIGYATPGHDLQIVRCDD